jgi:hypothetical protein
MLVVILPFSLLVALVQWQRQIQIGASLLVIGFGSFRLINRSHPRVLARIRPTQLGLWSFAVAIAHGAGSLHTLRAPARERLQEIKDRGRPTRSNGGRSTG